MTIFSMRKPFTKKFQSGGFHIRAVLATALLFVSLNGARAQSEQSVVFKVASESGKLKVSAIVPVDVKEVEIRIHSARNNEIVKYTDISRQDPKYDEIKNERKPYPREIWYPAVDIAREPGLDGVLRFAGAAQGKVLLNGPFVGKVEQVKSSLLVPASELVAWENSAVVEPVECRVEGFYLKMDLPVILRKVEHSFCLLTDDWQGAVELYDITGGAVKKLATAEVNNSDSSPKWIPGGAGLDKGRLLAALKATIDFTLRSQVDDPGSPADGGLYLFYDLDSRTYRNSYWMWGWGPSVKLLIAAAELPVESENSTVLKKAAEEIGRKSMEFQFLSDGNPLNEVRVGRWSQTIKRDGVYTAAITLADNQFLSGWAWIPLYELTGDRSFLDAAANLSRATGEMMEKFTIIPHSYLPELDTWYDFTICETGFGLEGLAEIYRVTGDKRYQDIGRKFMKQHQDVFQRGDGLWEREVDISSGKVVPTERHTRGQGWAMEGLLAAHRLYPEGGYLEHARRMADQMLAMQSAEGYWTFYADKPAAEVGISEKGTALWSCLLYQLYSHTGERKHLEGARKALLWCLDTQYWGDDDEAYGSIPGCSPQSAVGYRRWFNVSCVYTSAFFGLAILDELKLADK